MNSSQTLDGPLADPGTYSCCLCTWEFSLDDQEDAKVLPCSHVFCATCLGQYYTARQILSTMRIGAFPCPHCRVLTEVPHGGDVQDFPSPYKRTASDVIRTVRNSFEERVTYDDTNVMRDVTRGDDVMGNVCSFDIVNDVSCDVTWSGYDVIGERWTFTEHISDDVMNLDDVTMHTSSGADMLRTVRHVDSPLTGRDEQKFVFPSVDPASASYTDNTEVTPPCEAPPLQWTEDTPPCEAPPLQRTNSETSTSTLVGEEEEERGAGSSDDNNNFEDCRIYVTDTEINNNNNDNNSNNNNNDNNINNNDDDVMQSSNDSSNDSSNISLHGDDARRMEEVGRESARSSGEIDAGHETGREREGNRQADREGDQNIEADSEEENFCSLNSNHERQSPTFRESIETRNVVPDISDIDEFFSFLPSSRRYVDPTLDLFGSDIRYQIFRQDGGYPTAILLTSPQGAAVVADYGQSRLNFFDSNGQCHHTSLGLKPFSLARDPSSKRILVGDRKSKSLLILEDPDDPDGSWTSQWEPGCFPWIGGVGCLRNGNVVVYDRDWARIGVYSPAGEKIVVFGSYGSGDEGQTCMADFLAVDEHDRIIVSDSANHRVKIFDTTGDLLVQFGRRGRFDGGLDWPRGVCVDERSGAILVADSMNERVSMFAPSGRFVGHVLVDIDRPYGLACGGDGLLATTHYNRSGMSLCSLYSKA